MPENIRSNVLNAAEITRLAENEDMIANFDIGALDGVGSYDFRVGDVVWVTSEGKDPDTRNLEEQGELALEPGHAYAIKSMERLELPDTIQVQLSLRFRLAAKKLFYSGGIVDPGYSNALYFVIFNLSSSIYTIRFGDHLVRGEFRRVQPIENDQIHFDESTRDKESLFQKMNEGPDMKELLPSSPSRSRDFRGLEMINYELDELLDKFSSVHRTLDKTESRLQNIDKTANNSHEKISGLERDFSRLRNKLTEIEGKALTNEDNITQVRHYHEYLILVIVAAVIASVLFAIISAIL